MGSTETQNNGAGGQRQEQDSAQSKDKMPPPQGQPVNYPNTLTSLNQPPGSGQRQDSLSMYTNFNQPRLSTDSSISSFLNIDNQPDNRGSTSQMGQVPSNTGQELPYTRGFSIVNNLWNAPAPHPQNDVAFTTTRRQSEQLEPFMPKFNTSSFSQPSKGLQQQRQQFQQPQLQQGQQSQSVQQQQSQQQQQQQLQQQYQQQQAQQQHQQAQQQQQQSQASQHGQQSQFQQGTQNSQSQGHLQGSINNALGRPESVSSSKRNSLYFPTSDADLDFFNTGKRNSIAMKPPLIKPNGSGQNQQVNGADDMEVPFFQGPLSRKNSIKFNPEDFADFQFKRRDSSVRATLDNSNYMPAPPKRINDGSLSPIEHQMVDNEDVEDVETRLHKHLYSLVDNVKLDKSPPKKKQKATKKQKKATQTGKKVNDDEHQHHLDNGQMQSDNGAHMQSLTPLNNSISSMDDSKPLLGATKVDQLMLVIQARKNGVTDKVPRSADGSLLLESAPSIIPPLSQLVGGVEKPKSKGVKQFQCPYCHKYFTQSTHLEVHVRSHIGYKPFSCEFCGKRFTQGGNLRTHIRLHTGEKPYECERCGRKFSRKGNLAAHKLTHDNLKPFECKLDDCNKNFTQLGNMKAHQNRFHLQTLNRLTQRLAEMDPNENISQKERELLDYFASIYRNSNRGIKGRGKGNQNIVPLNSFDKHQQMDDPSVRVAAKALGSLTQSKQPSPMTYETTSNSSIPDKNNQFSFQDNETQLDDAAYAATGALGLGSRNTKTPSQKEKVHFKDVNFIR